MSGAKPNRSTHSLYELFRYIHTEASSRDARPIGMLNSVELLEYLCLLVDWDAQSSIGYGSYKFALSRSVTNGYAASWTIVLNSVRYKISNNNLEFITIGTDFGPRVIWLVI